MGLGTNLKKILKDKNLTIKELSKKSGVSINTLYSITKRDNDMSRYDIVKKIASALDVTVKDLTGYEIDETEIIDYDHSYSFASSKEEFDKYHERHQKEEASRKAPKFVTYDENGNEIKDRPIKFTDASTSIQEEQAREKAYNLFNSILDQETLSQGREKIAIQLGEILSSYSTLNEIGRNAAVESIKRLCYSNAMTESRLDTIYFNRIRNKIENGLNLTPDEIEWKYAYLEKSLKTIGDDFGIFYSMLNRKGQEQAYIKIDQALDQIIALTKIQEYQKKPDEPPQE